MEIGQYALIRRKEKAIRRISKLSIFNQVFDLNDNQHGKKNDRNENFSLIDLLNFAHCARQPWTWWPPSSSESPRS